MFTFAVLLGTAYSAQAGNLFCSDFPVVGDFHVVDGNTYPNTASEPSSIGIDTNCKFENFPSTKPLVSTLNFKNPNNVTPIPAYLVIFNNVQYTGNMACSNVNDKIWFTNSSNYGSSNSCQDLFIPVETLNKQAPGTYASVGVPFTYTITVPDMSDVGGPSPNTIGNVTILDDLSPAVTGADLTYLSNTAYVKHSDGTTTALGALTEGVLSTTLTKLQLSAPGPKQLFFSSDYNPALASVNAGDQVVIELTVVLDATATNAPDTVFTNSALWWFSRSIDLNADGIIQSNEFFDPLPGQGGSASMTIAAPKLVVTKSGTNALGGLNLGQWGTFSINVHNAGNADAWNSKIVDLLPQSGTGGMCDMTPQVTSVALAGNTLTQNTDFTVDYTGPNPPAGTPACQLTLTMLPAAPPIGSGQDLVINYKTKLDANSQNGSVLTNIAAAAQWSSQDSAQTFTCTPSPYTGTVGTDDCQDAHDVAVLLSGYWFEKSVANVTTGVDPAATAGPGNTLHYTLYLRASTAPFANVQFYDQLPADFDLTTLSLDTSLPAGALDKSNLAAGIIDIQNLNVAANTTVAIGFTVNLLPGLADGTVVTNQAQLQDISGNLIAVSDDPNVNGLADPAVAGDEDPTVVTVQKPQAPLKSIVPPMTQATIGQEVTYQITVPGAPYSDPLNNVVVSDTLDGALEYVGATAVDNVGNAVTLTDNSTAPGNVSLGIAQIPVGKQVIITLHTRVINSTTTSAGVSFSNAASFTYTGGISDPSTATTPITIVEPALAVTKAVINVTSGKQPTDVAAQGDVLQYTITIPNSGGSEGFDTDVVDYLPPNLQLLAGSATAQINGTAVSGFIATPTTLPSGALAWGRQNNDGSLDIPASQSLVLTYQVTVQSINGLPIDNHVDVDWTSLDGAQTPIERTGAGCPTTTAPNNYCTSGTASIPSVDASSIAKTVAADSWATGLSTGTDSILRVGDTVDYRLALTLREGQLDNVKVTDTLPAGLAFDSVVSISGGSNFSYTVVSQPTAGSTGLLTWDLGTVTNDVDYNTTNDTLVIVYRAHVMNNTLAQTASTSLTNNAVLSYTGSDPTATWLQGSAPITVLQPSLSVSKSAAPASGGTVLSAGEWVTYTVSMQNTGSAPAYDTVLSDITPLGMRDGGAPTTVSVSLLNAGTTLANVTPSYDSATGTATWTFNSAQYAIPPGDTLQIKYQVQTDSTIGAGVILANRAQVQHYYSLDSSDPNQANRQEYGATSPAIVQLTTASALALSKQALVPSGNIAIGQPFTYRITVPATPQSTALYDVQVTDDLSLATTGVSMSYLSASAHLASGAKSWSSLTNSGTTTNLVLADTTSGGLDVPANDQLIVDVTVVLNDDATNNTIGKQFQNTANYRYDSTNNVPASIANGAPGTSGALTIAGPNLFMTKSGPVSKQIRVGVPETFTLNVENKGTGTAWNTVLTDILPNVTTPAPAGMCGTAPTNVTAGIYQPDGTTLVTPLTIGTDFTVSYSGCTWTVTMKSAAAAIPSGDRLIVSYQASLDPGGASGVALTNVAGATQWQSADPSVAGAAGNVHTYAYTLTNGTLGVSDFQDAYTVTSQQPVLTFTKGVFDVTTGQSGATARPGDTLKYTLTIQNVSPVGVTNFSLTDELDKLNASAMFVPGSLQLVTVPSGADTTSTSPTGGAKGTGLVSVGGLNIDPQGGANDHLTIEFQAVLAPVITNGTAVLNQAQIGSIGLPTQLSDSTDATLPGTADPTRTLIGSAPALRVLKTSQDITSGSATVLPGDTLRYTITVKNIGTENAIGVVLRDQIPTNTTYVANSTKLNGAAVADPSSGVSALQNGMTINSPADATPGSMPADATATTGNVATITFDARISSNVVSGTVISNQGYVNGSGAGSGSFPEKKSDDPATPALDDPTLNVIGDQPLLVAQKTVQLVGDSNGNGVVDLGDRLRYTITITNLGSAPATDVVLKDTTPSNTLYVADSLRLNGATVVQPDDGSALGNGIGVVSSGLPLPVPYSSGGTVAPGGTGTVTFEVTVNSGTVDPACDPNPKSAVCNQGSVASAQLQTQLLTDADGDSSNGYQPTEIAVGAAQLMSITKTYTALNNGALLPGNAVEYTIKATNIGTVPATGVVITDDLTPISAQVTYVGNSAKMNGLATGTNYSPTIVSANYGTSLAPGQSVVLQFRVTLNSTLNPNDVVSNTASVDWDSPTNSATATTSFTVGAQPGSLNGRVWLDANVNSTPDGTEQGMAGWAVDVYRNDSTQAAPVLLGTVYTATDGNYQVIGLPPTTGTTSTYELYFREPGATTGTAMLGWGYSPQNTTTPYSTFEYGMQRISKIVTSGGSLDGLNLPVAPNGVVYNAISRLPVAGATLTMVDATTKQALPGSCFDDPAQQGQVTLANGYYRFDVNFSGPSCPAGGAYLIQVTPPAGYKSGESQNIPPINGEQTGPYSVPTCSADAVTTTPICEAQASVSVPSASVAARSAGTNYYLNLALDGTNRPATSQIFNNPIPLDPKLDSAVTITKTAAMVNVTRGQIVPYTIVVKSTYGYPLTNLSVVDLFPPGFKYVNGSGRVDGNKLEPTRKTTRALSWDNLQLDAGAQHTINLLLIVGAGVSEGDYVNRAEVIDPSTGSAIPGVVATATVRVTTDPTFDCTDIIGKVYDDKNVNGIQDAGEPGLPGVRVVSARGLIATTDAYGRYHITCAITPDEDRGSNFILKVDDRTLPSGYRLTTENPRVQRVTRGKMAKFNFGAAIRHVVTLDLADGVFEPNSTQMRPQWTTRIPLLMSELEKGPSVLRIAYLADVEEESLVNDRLAKMADEIKAQWEKLNCCYQLTIETEVFWRRGGPPDRSSLE